MYVPKNFTGAATSPNDCDLVGEEYDAALDHLQGVLGLRAAARLNDTTAGAWLHQHRIDRVFLAGGALLNDTPEDLDLFPARGPDIHLAPSVFLGTIDQLQGKQLAEVQLADVKLQLCRMTDHSNLSELLAEFDFAHCQVGADLAYDYPTSKWVVKNVSTTNHFLVAMATQGTYYLPARWPLRSLGRVPKVAIKLGLTRHETQALTYQVMAHVASLGLEACIAADPDLHAQLYPNKVLPPEPLLEGI